MLKIETFPKDLQEEAKRMAHSEGETLAAFAVEAFRREIARRQQMRPTREAGQ